jgi:hypothetical protein
VNVYNRMKRMQRKTVHAFSLPRGIAPPSPVQ